MISPARLAPCLVRGAFLCQFGRGYLLIAFLILASQAMAQYWVRDDTFAPVTEGYPGAAYRPSLMPFPGGRALVYAPIVNGRDLGSKTVRLDADGNLDPTFPGLPSSERITLAIYPDGRILFASAVDSSTVTRLVQRALADGTVDPNFSSFTVNYNSFRAKILKDGSILLYGDFGVVAGTNRKRLALINADGTLNAGFQSPFEAMEWASLFTVVPTEDEQHLLVAGRAFAFGGEGDKLFRVGLDGSWDQTFVFTGANSSNTVLNIYPLAGDAALVVTANRQVARLKADGSVDPTFVAALAGSPQEFGARQVDGKIFYTTNVSGAPVLRQLRRMNPDGSDDTTFTIVSTARINVGQVQVELPTLSDDGTFFVGPLTQERYDARQMITRVRGDGTVDDTYLPRFSRYGQISAFTRQTDGKVILSGPLDHINNTPMAGEGAFVRLNANGTIDTSFYAARAGSYYSSLLKLLPDGKIMAAGHFRAPDGVTLHGVMRFMADGSEDGGYQPIPYGLNYTAIDTTGRAYGMDSGGVMRRYTADGQMDPTFQVTKQFSGPLRLAPVEDGSLYVFQASPTEQPMLTRLTPTGAVDFTKYLGQSLNSGLGVLPDSSILVVEPFSTAIGAGYGTALKLWRLQANGTLTLHYTSTGYYGTTAPEAVQLDVAGAVLSLLKQISSASEAAVFIDLQAAMKMTLNCSGDNQAVLLRPTNEGSGARLSRYLRSPSNEPGFAAAPTIGGSSPPNLLLWPVGVTLLAYVDVAGLSPLNFQWYRNDEPVPGANGQMLVIQKLQASDAGNYKLTVSNSYGSATSAVIPVTIDTEHALAEIVTQPASQAVQPGETATFTVAATGNPTPQYQWRFNGTPLTGKTGATLVVANAQPGDVGVYDVLVSNTVTTPSVTVGTSKRSDPVTLVLGDPGIITQPLNQQSDVGGSVTFSVVAAGTAPFSYQWRRAGEAIPGATASNYTLNAIQSVHAGSYDVVVTNYAGDIISQTATLTVAGFARWKEMQFTPTERADGSISGATADPDGDGLGNLLEYALGLSPTQANSGELPVVEVGAGAWTYTYTRPGSVIGLIYAVEVSTDLVNWSTSGVTLQKLLSAGDTETWQGSYSLASASSVFFRLKVTQL